MMRCRNLDRGPCPWHQYRNLIEPFGRHDLTKGTVNKCGWDCDADHTIPKRLIRIQAFSDLRVKFPGPSAIDLPYRMLGNMGKQLRNRPPASGQQPKTGNSSLPVWRNACRPHFQMPRSVAIDR